MLKKFIISAFFITSIGFAQTNFEENLYTPQGKMETVFDCFGNAMRLKDINFDPKISLQNGERLTSNHLSTVGIFKVYYEEGSGFEKINNPNHTAQRNVVEKVLLDISNFLDSPLKVSGDKVNIWIRDVNQFPNATNQTLAMASGYYNVPKIDNIGGFLDNEVWKTINTGQDSYKNTISQNIGNNSSKFYHGVMAFKTNGIKWNTNLSRNANRNEYDLYSQVLKQVTKTLGLVSLINQNGTSKFGVTRPYYSRYDSFLKDSNGNTLLSSTNTISSQYAPFATNTSSIHLGCTSLNNSITNCNTAILFVGSQTIPVYTPPCYNFENSLSTFENNCLQNLTTNYYVNQHQDQQGQINRFLKPEERIVLADLGYGVNATFGNVQNLNNFNYGNYLPGFTVVGVNNGLSETGYFKKGVINTPFSIAGFLTNDLGNVNITFNGLQDLTDSNATLSHTTGNTTTALTFQSSKPGLHILRYVPVNTLTGKKGNISYLYVHLVANCTTNFNNCDYIFNGGFEEQVNIEDFIAAEIGNACNWENGSINGGILFSDLSNSLELSIATTYYHVYDDFFGLQYELGAIAQKMRQPLLPNTQYKLSFKAAPFSNYGNFPNSSADFQIYFGFNAPILPLTANGNNPIEPNGILLTQNISFNTNPSTMPQYTITFTTGSQAGQEYIYLGGFNAPNTNVFLNPYNGAYFNIDDVSLTPINTDPVTIRFPNNVCSNATLINLQQYVTPLTTQVGFFSGPGVTENNGVYSFNAAAVGVGTHTISYFDSLNCPPTTATITVIACARPYISQVYSNGTNDKYLEVKNTSNTSPINAGRYYAVWFENGSTTPTGWIDLGNIPAQAIKTFRATAANPLLAIGTVATAPTWNFASFDGLNDRIIISTTNNNTAFTNRVDLFDGESNAKSMVRVSCMPVPRQAPQTTYDEQDWVAFTTTEVNDNTNKKNSILGRHWDDPLVWSTTGWVDASTDESNPDRSRVVRMATNYTTASQPSFEACSLSVATNSELRITDSKYVSVQTSTTVTDFGAKLIIDDRGSLVMVRDIYYGVSGTDLVNLGSSSNTLSVDRKTVGINAATDYVYWASPLSNNPLNPVANSIFPFGTTPGLFNPSRFFIFENINFYDGLATYGDNGSGTDGYDDQAGINQNPNQIDYVPFSVLTTAQNQQLIAGRGYPTFPPINDIDGYTIKFSGEMNNGIVTVPVYRNDSAPGANPNLVGNPYPSPIDLNVLLAENSSLIEPLAFIWGRSNPDDPLNTNPGPDVLNYREDNFLIFNPTMIIDPTFTGNIAFNSQGLLASCQSFFVRTKNSPSLPQNNTGTIQLAGNLTFKNKMRSILPNTTFARSTSNTELGDKIWLNVTDASNYSAQLGIAFNNLATAAFNDNEDIKTIQGRKYNFYTQSTTEDLIIDVQDAFTTNKIIPLGLLNISDILNQAFTISVPKKGGVFNSQTIYLEDSLLQICHNLTASPYSFTTSQTITEGTFKLRFTPVEFTANNKNSFENNVTARVQIKTIDNKIEVKSLGAKIEAVYVIDLYTPNTSNYIISEQKNINNFESSIAVDKQYKLLNIKVLLQDGSVINKKILR